MMVNNGFTAAGLCLTSITTSILKEMELSYNLFRVCQKELNWGLLDALFFK